MVRTRRDCRCYTKQARLFKGERKLFRGGISITAAAATAVAAVAAISKSGAFVNN